jgi:hypothetical protein
VVLGLWLQRSIAVIVVVVRGGVLDLLRHLIAVFVLVVHSGVLDLCILDFGVIGIALKLV